jgi:hypothetical protein
VGVAEHGSPEATVVVEVAIPVDVLQMLASAANKDQRVWRIVPTIARNPAWKIGERSLV